tara:strand:- start:1528 stop:2694 length:1167 start_codon:yes stop_codon:yes gene_type:complete
MSAHANPDIVDDNLVFMYDTDDGKSYKGEPTVNLITNSGTSNTGWVGYGWTGSQVISSDYSNTYEFTATNGWHNRTFDTGVTSGGTIYVSFQYKLKQQQTTQNQIFVLNGTHLGSYTNYIGNGSMSFEWQTFSGSFTANANSSKIAIGPRGQDSSGLTDIVYIRNLQVEQKPHATQFVNGTRSATQGLIDRTGTSTINISNTSFDSNAQMAFDGTDDYALTTFTPSADDNKTISIWVNFDTLSSSYRYVVGLDYSNATDGFIPLSVASYNGNWVLRMRQQLGTLGTNLVVYSDVIVNTGEWINLVISSNGSAFSFYKNGVKGSAVGTNNGRWFSILNEPIMIGSSDWLTNQLYSTTDGKIANVSIYNKQLTDAEILQNFNATKSRFGL